MSTELAGTPGTVLVHIHASAVHGAFNSLHLTFGDGTWSSGTDTSDCGGVDPSAPRVDTPFDHTDTVTHTYAAGGTYHAQASIVVASACPEPPGEVDHWAIADTDVDIPSGFGANGPTPPRLDLNIEGTGADRTIYPSGWDADGWIDSITIDWGDGSVPTTVHNTQACGMNGGYATGTAFTPGGQPHHYTTAGTHTATVTARSTDCSGNQPQTTTQAVPLT